MSDTNKMPKRIVVIGGYARSLVHFRGPLLQALRDQGHQVIAMAPRYDAMSTESTENIAQQLAAWGVHFIPIDLARTGLDPRQDARSMRQLVCLLRELRPDIVLSYTIKPVIYGSLAAHMAGVRHIYAMVTGLGYAFSGHRNLLRRGLNLLVQRLYRQAFRVCERVIFQNPDDRDQLVGLGLLPAAKTALVNGSGLDIDHYFPRPLPPEPVFLLIARLLPEKGISEYVQAAARVRKEVLGSRFLLLGPIDTSTGSYGMRDIREWEAQGIEYLGETKDIRPFMEQASVFVLPSYREGTPRTVLEAMAMSRPVITTDAPGCRETVIPGQTGYLVPVCDTAELADRMIELAQNEVLREQFGKAGRKFVCQKYDVQQVNARMLDILGLGPERIQDVAGGRGSTKARLRPYDPVKRVLDVLISGLGLATLGLPMLVLAFVVRSRLGSPVLFQQVRPGRYGDPFKIYKFRTMTDERGPDGELLPDARRLTPFGAWLRSTSLDELPELFNVLKGEMSLVGPRPLLTRYTPFFTETERQRFNVRPGITGWAQVNGRNTASWDDRLAMDVWYVQNRSLGLDLKILWLTVRKVLGRSGVVVDAESIMQNLDDERRGRLAHG